MLRVFAASHKRRFVSAWDVWPLLLGYCNAASIPGVSTCGNTRGSAAPGAANAVDAVAEDVRGETGDIANTGTPASGAPSVDPEAARKGARTEK